jgi:uncharacterized protein (TIGR02145 family)
LKTNCDIYGGLYRWDEMMQYNPSDTGQIGTTQGICPVGWHIPTQKEWATLVENVGGDKVAGASLKEAGLSHWSAPNIGATDESGFTALPGGYYAPPSPPPGGIGYDRLGYDGAWWTSSLYYLNEAAYNNLMDYNTESLDPGFGPPSWGLSVRCVKNPSK